MSPLLEDARRARSGAPEVEPDWLEQHLDEVDVIDLRERDELLGEWGHIPGARWVPQRHLLASAAGWDRSRPTVLIDRAGRRAGAAAVELERAGFRAVAALTGGMIRWRESGRPVSRDWDVIALVEEEEAPATETWEGPVDVDFVIRALAQPGAVRWTSLAALLVTGSESCVDGRDGHAVLGSPGGDAGELLLALAAVEQVLERPLTRDEITRALDAMLSHFGRLYLHTDQHALDHLGERLSRLPRFHGAPVGNLDWLLQWIQAPPRELEEALLVELTRPEHVGCGHLRLALSVSDAYGLRPQLARETLAAIFRARWRGGPIDLVSLHGDHHEEAVLVVTQDGPLRPFTRVPMLAPRLGGHQVFVHHPQVAAWLREQVGTLLVDVAELVSPERCPELCERIQTLGAQQLAATLERLAGGLPAIEVHFTGGVPVVREA